MWLVLGRLEQQQNFGGENTREEASGEGNRSVGCGDWSWIELDDKRKNMPHISY
jgi:hypothetical protein